MKMIDVLNEATPVAPGQQDMGADPVAGIQSQLDLAKKQKQDLDKRIQDLQAQLNQAKAAANKPPAQQQQQQQPPQGQQPAAKPTAQAAPNAAGAAAPAGVTQTTVG